MSRLNDRRNARKVNVNGLRRDPRTGAGALAKSERGYGGALAFDFTDKSLVIYDPTTQANITYTQGSADNGSFRGPGSKLTYTSPSVKMTLGPSGTYRYGAHNHVPYSETVSSWTNTGSPTTVTDDAVYYGSIALSQVTENATDAGANYGRQINAIAHEAGAQYNFVFYVKYGDLQYVQINFLGAVSYIDVTVGTVPTNNHSITMTDVGSGIWKVEGSYTPAASSQAYYLLPTDTSSTSAHTGVVGYKTYFGGLHVYRYPADTTYLKTTTAARYDLPYEWDTSAALQGIRVEPEATNLLTYSADLSNSNWVEQLAAAMAIDATGPDGLTSATTLVDDSGGGTGSVGFLRGVTVSTATAYTYSIFAKASGLSWTRIVLSGFTTPADGSGCYFDLSTGSLGTASGVSAAISDVGNGWYRCSITFTTDAADTTGTLVVRPANADGDSTVDRDGTSSILVFNPQLELGSIISIATSPILTYGATATRAVDNITLATSAFPHSATTQTAYIEGGSNSSAAVHLTLHDGTGNERILIYNNGTNLSARVVDGGVSQAEIASGEDGTAAYKAAVAYAANDVAFSANGGAAGTDASATLPTVTTLQVGGNHVPSNAPGGVIQKVLVLPRRVSNAELVTRTK